MLENAWATDTELTYDLLCVHMVTLAVPSNSEDQFLLWIMRSEWSRQPSSQLLHNELGHAGFQKILEKEIVPCAVVSTKEEV